jgi:hypothetical protein
MVKYYALVYENGTRPVETVLRKRRGDKGE